MHPFVKPSLPQIIMRTNTAVLLRETNTVLSENLANFNEIKRVNLNIHSIVAETNQ